MHGIYYPEFFFVDEYINDERMNPHWSASNFARWHINRIKWLLLVNDTVHIPLDNFVFVPTERRMIVRNLFLTSGDIRHLFEHRLIYTNEHGPLDFRASHELYVERRDQEGWKIGERQSDIPRDVLAAMPSRASNPAGEVDRFLPAIRNLVANLEMRAGRYYPAIKDLLSRAEALNGAGDFSTEYFAEQIIKSDWPEPLKRTLLFHTRRAFYNAFALEPGFLHWYSDEMSVFDLSDGIMQKEQANSFLCSPTFTQAWLSHFMAADEISAFLNGPSGILTELREGELAPLWRAFREYVHCELIPTLDYEIDAAYRRSRNINEAVTLALSADAVHFRKPPVGNFLTAFRRVCRARAA